MTDAQDMLALIRGIRGTRVEPGLTAHELELAAALFDARFPPDLEELLRLGLPTGQSWPDWRAAARDPEGEAAQKLCESLAWPLKGMLFDIEHDSFWDPQWGVKPAALADARRIATEAVQTAPRLIPVFAHRYIPTEPHLAGNPVLSVYQADIIVYGRTLYTYFIAESKGWAHDLAENARPIRAWTRWMNAEWNASAS
ncbi:MAG TPA: hypothetical protein VFF65_04295 [Phycisphaerales bacterium]|nr:hypothetical protein [Phycisphaerales bacterium]